MTPQIMPGQFDYCGLDAETRIVVQQRTCEIKTIARRAATDVIEIGQKLLDVKQRLGHGKFGAWLEAEFAWSEPSAQRFMRVAERFQNRQIDGFAPSALYMLASPSVPDEARAEALQYAEAGERITVTRAQAIVDQYKSDTRSQKLEAEVGDTETEDGTTEDTEHTDEVRRLAGAVLGWLGGPAVGEMSVAQLQHAARLTGSALDLEGWHTRRAGGRNFDWESLMGHLARTLDADARQGPVQAAVEQVRGEIVERLRQIEDGAVAEDEVGGSSGCTLQIAGHPGEAGAESSDSEPALCDPELDEPTLTTEELGEIVQAWLDRCVEENEIPDDRESQRTVLRGILNGRANGFAPHWKSLRSFGEWPEETGQDAMLEGVRSALTKLASPRLTERRPPSWAGVTPTRAADAGSLTYPRPRPIEPAVEKQMLRRLARKDEHIHALLTTTDLAATWLKRYLQSRDEPDESAVELLGQLERAAADVMADD